MPRSAGRRPSAQPGRGQAHRAVLDERPIGDGRRRANAHFDGRLVALARLHGRLEVEEDPRVGRLLEIELLDLVSPCRAVVRQWIRLKESPGAHGRTVVASGRRLQRAHRLRVAPSTIAVGSRQCGSGSTRG